MIRGRALLLSAVVGAASCAPQAPSSLAPKGPAAARIADLFWIMLGLGGAVYVLATVLFLIGAVRRGRTEDAPGERSERRWIVRGGIVLPSIILIPLLAFTLWTTTRVLDLEATERVRIEVVAKQYWWEVRYREPTQAITANEIRIPAGEPVELLLTSDDVIHSFWVPELAGKIDNVPGRTNTLTIQADEPGRYRGQCAEYCGLQHAKMAFYVIAEPPDVFSDWLTRISQPAETPGTPEAEAGLEVFLEQTCVACHTIRGTPADGELGPDLTHLALRTTIGAGFFENEEANLKGWILDPQTMKPGVLMPPTQLSPQELDDLYAYLSSLE